MKINKFAKLCAWSLGFALLIFLPYSLVKETISFELSTIMPENLAIVNELSRANIIYLGEVHDSLKDHQAQLEIIQALHKKNARIAIALEMFQRPFQSILNEYLAGKISEAELREKTEYEQRWGFDWEYYAPILRWAKTHQLSLLALNTPSEISRKVARQGLDSLNSSELLLIPSKEEIKLDNQAYRQMVYETYQQHIHGGHGNSRSFENFFTTQVLWDETMAETIAKFVRAHPNYQIIVLAGRNHIIYEYGIPSRVARRLGKIPLIQRSVFFENASDKEFKAEENPVDYFWK